MWNRPGIQAPPHVKIVMAPHERRRAWVCGKDFAFISDPRPTTVRRPVGLDATLLNLQQLDVKRQRGVGRDYTRVSARAVSEARRDAQLALSPHVHG